MADTFRSDDPAAARDAVFPDEQEERNDTGLMSGLKSMVRGIGRATQRASNPPDRFKMMVRRLKGMREFNGERDTHAPNGYFSGRPIISECSKVNGGVYLGVLPQEALVVDEQHGLLPKMYRELQIMIKSASIGGTLTERTVFNAVTQLVERRLPFDPQRFDDLACREQIACDLKVSLDLFITERCGLARHQVLLAAWLIEKLKADGQLSGLGIIDGRTYAAAYNDDRLLYIAPVDGLLIFDPLKNFENRLLMM